MFRVILFVCALMTAVPTGALAQPAPPSGYGPPIAAREALALIERGMAQSAAQGLKMAFAIVEPSGELVAFARMDDAPYASTQIAQQKARTAARLRVATADLEERVQGGRVALLSSDEVIAIGGGVPIVVDGRVIGAIGVSGATAAQDAAIATAAIEPR